jgi:hypothetical protein
MSLCRQSLPSADREAFVRSPFNLAGGSALTLPNWERQWERRALYGFVQQQWRPPGVPSSIHALYGAAGISNQLALVQVESPFAALIAGGIAAAILEVVRDPGLPGRESVIAWLNTATPDPAPQGSVQAAVRRVIAFAQLSRQSPLGAHPEESCPPHSSAEDRAVWRATDGGARVAVSRVILDAARQQLLDTSIQDSRPDLARMIMPRLACLRSMVERAVDEAGRDLAEQRSTSRSFTFDLASTHTLITRIFGRDVRLAYRSVRLAVRMLDLAILDADRYAPIDFWRRRAGSGTDWASWDALIDALWSGGPRIVHPAFCIVSKPPEVLHFDEQGRPHAPNGPFCRWADGSALYAVHGLAVPVLLAPTPDTITVAGADAVRKPEIRRAIIGQLGPERYLRDSRAAVRESISQSVAALSLVNPRCRSGTT